MFDWNRLRGAFPTTLKLSCNPNALVGQSPIHGVFFKRLGDVAQLGERYNRTVEVGGSSPPVSTKRDSNWSRFCINEKSRGLQTPRDLSRNLITSPAKVASSVVGGVSRPSSFPPRGASLAITPSGRW